MTNIVGLTKYDRLQAQVNAVVARDNFDASDEAYFAGNGRLVRLRTPLPTEAPKACRSIALLGFASLMIVVRANTDDAPRPVALVTLTKDEMNTVKMEAGRWGDDQILDLVRKPNANWYPM